ncbi:MAG TPA: sensor histidine kinase [Streptosporangiaceae bacterium]|nr:sensor histidine kinase [Streptosporangiaceae bacterium]
MSIPWQVPPPTGQRSQRPPLSKRLRPGHWVALDYLAAALCAVMMFVNTQKAALRYDFGWSGLTGTLMSVVIAVAVSIPVAVRRRNPLATLVASVVAAVMAPLFAAIVTVTSRPPAPFTLPGTNLVPDIALRSAPVFFLPVGYVIYLVAALCRRTVAVIALGLVLSLLAIEAFLTQLNTGLGGTVSLFPALIVIIFWIVGYAAGQRRAYAAQLQDQAAIGAVTEERLRIARELHDVVAHSMTVIAVQAGYGHHVIDDQPAKAREALGAIQATSREALAEMRRMLGVLRQSSPPPYKSSKLQISDVASGQNGTGTSRSGELSSIADAQVTREAAPLAPAPGLADLDRLLSRIGNAGVRVDLRVNGSRRKLPQGIDLAAFRIVQEALTNVVKHADTSSASVTISYLDGEVAIVVVDQGRGCPVPAATGARGEPGADPPGGHGLIGMRERVSLYGGELTAQPLPERGFRVAARLPVSGDTL